MVGGNENSRTQQLERRNERSERSISAPRSNETIAPQRVMVPTAERGPELPTREALEEAIESQYQLNRQRKAALKQKLQDLRVQEDIQRLEQELTQSTIDREQRPEMG
ncbi:MAG: hypothetical protein M1827_004069 [Pycnora praestabilis]|nr:MAG: hypothetical protein M1827_004069 [Pycnora praestabilis]